MLATYDVFSLHNGAAEIVRLIDYLAGRSSGQYTPNNPFWYKHYNPYDNIGSASVPDTIGNSFHPRYLPQQTPSQYSANSPWHVMDDQSSLSQGKTLKIHELKRLMNKYPQYHENPDGIIRLAIYNSINGDNTLLDDKLEQLRNLDRLVKY